MVNTVVLFLLFLLPLVIIPVGFSHFEAPKVYIFQALVILATLVVFISKGPQRFLEIPKSILIPVGLIFLISIGHLLLFQTQFTLFGNIFRFQGTFTLWLLLLFTLLSNTQKTKPPWWLPLITLAGLGISSYISDPTQLNRDYGTLGEPNALGTAAVFLWPFVFLQSKNNIVRAFALLLAIVLIWESGSRSAIIALVIQIAFLGAMKFLKLSLSKAAILGFMLFLLSFSLPFIQGGGKFENRAEIWKAALSANNYQHDKEQSKYASLIGHGFGNIEVALKNSSSRVENNIRFEYVDSAHNIFLDWWIAGGILGLGSLLFLIIRGFWINLRNKSSLYLALFLGLITCLSFNPASIVGLIHLWWLIGRSDSKSEAE